MVIELLAMSDINIFGYVDKFVSDNLNIAPIWSTSAFSMQMEFASQISKFICQLFVDLKEIKQKRKLDFSKLAKCEGWIVRL